MAHGASLMHPTLAAFTSTFDSSGQLKDIVEATTQSGRENFVTFTAAELMQSLSMPGTLTFVGHGEHLIHCNPGVPTDGLKTSYLFWQNISSQQGAIQSEVTLGQTLHYAGAVVGAGFNTAAGALAGYGLGRIAVVGVGMAIAPELVGPFAARMIVGSFIAGGVTTQLSNGWIGGGTPEILSRKPWRI